MTSVPQNTKKYSYYSDNFKKNNKEKSLGATKRQPINKSETRSKSGNFKNNRYR